MTFLYLSAEGGTYVREHFNPEVYHIDNIKGNSCFAPTTNLEQSYYFLRNVHGTFVALDKLITDSYSTTEKDRKYLQSIKQQYIPEALI